MAGNQQELLETALQRQSANVKMLELLQRVPSGLDEGMKKKLLAYWCMLVRDESVNDGIIQEILFPPDQGDNQ